MFRSIIITRTINEGVLSTTTRRRIISSSSSTFCSMKRFTFYINSRSNNLTKKRQFSINPSVLFPSTTTSTTARGARISNKFKIHSTISVAEGSASTISSTKSLSSLMGGISTSSTLPLQVTVGILCASFWRGAWYIFDYVLFPNDRILSSITSLSLGSILLGFEQYILSTKYNGTKLLVKLLPPPKNISLRQYYKKINRFIRLYGIAISCILVWRGAWVMWDVIADEVNDIIVEQRKNTKNKTKQLQQNNKDEEEEIVVQSKNPIANNIHTHEHEDVVSHHDIDTTLFYSGIISHITATLGLLFIGRFKSVMAPPANVSMMKDIFIHSKGKTFHKQAKTFTYSN